MLAILLVYIWKKGIDQVRSLWKKKNSVLAQLALQREEIKATSDDLRQPMSRMTSIIMNLSEREASLEEREQLNSLHSQMLQIITRVSDMQSMLENPEQKAKQKVNKQFQLDSHGEMALPETVSEELTYEIKHNKDEQPISGFRMFFIDDNDDFRKYIVYHLHTIYEMHAYADAHTALLDVETLTPDIVVCKQDLPGMTGTEMCNKIKSNAALYKIKFVLLTDAKLSGKEIMTKDITMAADDYIGKPFNLQEAVARFNKLLGIGPIEVMNNLIEGAETRMLEDRNSSMTTATETIDYGTYKPMQDDDNDDQIKAVTIRPLHRDDTDNGLSTISTGAASWSMTDAMDQRLLNSIEQYVQQNMSRGQINLEEMASVMGMAMRPFFQKVRDITGKTPAEVVRDIRLKNACLLLKRTNINMNELATNVGFSTADQFIKLFKERFGMLPSEYRLKFRG
jgi:AraC-like DNA-binding protein/DNA-binding response OmpR family regulator